jgi:hypothetical protein
LSALSITPWLAPVQAAFLHPLWVLQLKPRVCQPPDGEPSHFCIPLRVALRLLYLLIIAKWYADIKNCSRFVAELQPLAYDGLIACR